MQVRDTVQPNAGTMIQAVSDVNRDWIAEQAESDVRTLCHPSAVPFEPAQSAGIALGGLVLRGERCLGRLQLAKGISQYQPGKMVVNDTLLKLARTSPYRLSPRWPLGYVPVSLCREDTAGSGAKLTPVSALAGTTSATARMCAHSGSRANASVAMSARTVTRCRRRASWPSKCVLVCTRTHHAFAHAPCLSAPSKLAPPLYRVGAKPYRACACF